MKKYPEDQAARGEFLKYRDILKKLIKETKENYYKRKFSDAKNDAKKQWQ